MLTRSLSRNEVRDVDTRAIQRYGLPGIVLMENAGRGAAACLAGLGVSGRVVICAGKGNNGGDGFVIARHLELFGIDVRVLLCCQPADLTGDAALNYHVLQQSGLAGTVLGNTPDQSLLRTELAGAEWIVDALLGTGTRGEIREPFFGVIAGINAAGRKVLAVDLPSGMDCDTGLPLGICARADHTVTFVSRKIGFDVPSAAMWTGKVHVVDIGVPRQLLREIFAAP